MIIKVFGILLLFGAWMVLGAPASDPDKSAAIVEQLDTGDNKDLETAEWWGWGGWGWGGPWGGWGGPWGGWGDVELKAGSTLELMVTHPNANHVKR
ncbi:hypothetical protein M8J77_007496 [Diaphorina citri]|nr:hypothetical protein M8J77_007496 [Diaphorina citri]